MVTVPTVTVTAVTSVTIPGRGPTPTDRPGAARRARGYYYAGNVAMTDGGPSRLSSSHCRRRVRDS